jgi:hypothetical protein
MRAMHDLKLEALRNVRVKHCHDAFGVILESQAGWKFVYAHPLLCPTLLLTHPLLVRTQVQRGLPTE